TFPRCWAEWSARWPPGPGPSRAAARPGQPGAGRGPREGRQRPGWVAPGRRRSPSAAGSVALRAGSSWLLLAVLIRAACVPGQGGVSGEDNVHPVVAAVGAEAGERGRALV